ncbi:MAG: hypothetical protein AABX66_03375 [Nanoarchaeota archaeon]
MSLGLSCGLCHRQELSMGQYHYLELPQGELELLSLHRIKNRIGSMEVHPQVRSKISLGLIKRNAQDRELNQHGRYSLGINDLDSTCDEVKDFLNEQAKNVAEAYRKFTPETYARAKDILVRAVDTQDTKIRKWFVDNYDNLIYDTNSKIPWPIVRRMRNSLEMWAVGETSFLSEPVEDLVVEVVKSCGRSPDEFEDIKKMWDFLKTQN